MYRVNSYAVFDILRGRSCNSIKEAHEQYAPEMPYSTFCKKVIQGKFPFLTCQPNQKVVGITPNPSTMKKVIDLSTGYIWESIGACAAYLGVSHQAILSSIKKERPCRGHRLALADCTKR